MYLRESVIKSRQVLSQIYSVFSQFSRLQDKFALLHPGDLGYAMGSAYIWDVWGTLVEPITSRVPYMVTVGNHEYDHVGSIENPVVHHRVDGTQMARHQCHGEI